MINFPLPSDLIPLEQAARRLSIPAGWLREEIEAGRLPVLRAGQVILVHVPTLARLLAERAMETGVRHGD
ncbi:MAG: hypothetical protein RIG82_05745 [Phycisphaeraceae bacterium]